MGQENWHYGPHLMRLTEFESQGTTVCLFRGKEDSGQVGNAELEQISQAVGGKTFLGNDSASAIKYYAGRPDTKLVVVGYSLGAQGVRDMQRLNPVLSITIAGWWSTLEQLATISRGPWHNFYQQRELDKFKGSTYKPGGIAHQVSYEHSPIVGGVANQVIELIKSQGTAKPQLSRSDRLANKYNESQGRGKNFN